MQDLGRRLGLVLAEHLRDVDLAPSKREAWIKFFQEMQQLPSTKQWPNRKACEDNSSFGPCVKGTSQTLEDLSTCDVDCDNAPSWRYLAVLLSLTAMKTFRAIGSNQPIGASAFVRFLWQMVPFGKRAKTDKQWRLWRFMRFWNLFRYAGYS
eukprot:symbB.v1.2.030507.t1/scaffold3444.1/size68748/1